MSKQTKQQLITRVSAGFVSQQGMLTKMSVRDLEWVSENPTETMQIFMEAVKNRPQQTCCYITDTFTILVDETKMVEELVFEGKYDRSNSDVVSKNFPCPKNGTKDNKNIVLFHFGKMMTSEQVIAKMDREGYRPATVHELLALGACHPDLQRQFPIIALGSVCVLNGKRRVVFQRFFWILFVILKL